MASRLLLNDSEREKFIGDLTEIKTMFIDRIEPIFADPEQEATDYARKLWSNIIHTPCYSEEDVFDPSDYVDSIFEAGGERYILLSLMRYRNICMWIACLCQVWEQQIYSHILHEAFMDGIEYDLKDSKKGFSFCKDIFNLHGQPLDKLKSWKKIRELRLLVNVIKHAEGDSATKLKEIRPDFFEKHLSARTVNLMDRYHTSLLDETLEIDKEDFVSYYEALVQFWNELPDEMYTADYED